MKNLVTKMSVGLASVVGLLGLSTLTAHAAADADLTAGLASTSSIFTDNKSTIILFFVGVVAVVLIIKIAIAAMGRGSRMVVGGVSGGKRRR